MGSTIIHCEVVPAGATWSRVIKAGEPLRIVDTHARRLSIFCAIAPKIRLSAPCSQYDQESRHYTADQRPHAVFAQGPALFSIEEDSFGGHDTMWGCCSMSCNQTLYGVSNTGFEENFLTAHAGHGPGWEDIVPNVNRFMTVPVDTAGGAHAALGSSPPEIMYCCAPRWTCWQCFPTARRC